MPELRIEDARRKVEGLLALPVPQFRVLVLWLSPVEGKGTGMADRAAEAEGAGMPECVRCGTKKGVGKVITVSPYGRVKFEFDVCMKDIEKIEAFLRGEAKIVRVKKHEAGRLDWY